MIGQWCIIWCISFFYLVSFHLVCFSLLFFRLVILLSNFNVRDLVVYKTLQKGLNYFEFYTFFFKVIKFGLFICYEIIVYC